MPIAGKDRSSYCHERRMARRNCGSHAGGDLLPRVEELEMTAEKETWVKAFKSEWSMREILTRAEKFSEKEIQDHRKYILHSYHLTEEDVQ